MLTLQYTSAGVSRKMQLAVDSLSTLDQVLRRFNKEHLRPKIDQKFRSQGPGWPGLAQATIERRGEQAGSVSARIRAKALNSLDRSLEREQGRAERALYRSLTTPKQAHLTERRQKVLERHHRLRAEFERVRAGGMYPLPKEAGKLGERIGRRHARAEERIRHYESGQALGQIASSIGSKIQAHTLIVESRIEWAGVHNEGGVAGHGAKIPARTFLELDAEDLDVLARMTAEHMAQGQG